MKFRGLILKAGLMACISNAAFGQDADSTSPGRLWGTSQRVQTFSKATIPAPQPAPSGAQFSYSGGVCGGYIFGPPGAAITLEANDASGCNGLGGCQATKTLNSDGNLAILPGSGGSGGSVFVYSNGKLVTTYLTASNCSTK